MLQYWRCCPHALGGMFVGQWLRLRIERDAQFAAVLQGCCCALGAELALRADLARLARVLRQEGEP
ncbi:hypothetical protein ACU4GD_13775 [Cupriavidus basilensis]